jgi:singapore isolate B (sub-type 7) whole genome shotgun sequence assembly, scaffold_7
MISVFDYSFLDQFYSFYHNSILPLNITNFIAFALDHRTYSVHFHQERDS